MPFTNTWDETAPSDSQSASLGAQDFRDLKKDLRERSAIDHYYLAIEGSDSKIGYHKKVTLVDAVNDLAAVSGATVLYGKTISGKIELFLVMSDGTIIQLTTSNGLLNIAALSGLLGVTQGGTGLSSFSAGDMIYASASNVLVALAKQTNGQILKLVSGIPAWSWGGIVQQIESSDRTSRSLGSSALSDPVPTWNTGNAYSQLDVTITPKNANNILIVEYGIQQTDSGISSQHIALFKDPSGSDQCIADWRTVQSASQSYGYYAFSFRFGVAGSTSATTFKLRIGQGNAVTVNDFGSKNYSFMRVTEIATAV